MKPQTPTSRASTRAAHAARPAAVCAVLGALTMGAVAAFAPAYERVAGAQGATARLTPSEQSIEPGGVVTLTLGVSGVNDVAGFQAGIDWDDALLAFEDVAPTDWLGSTGRRIETLPPRTTNRTLDFLVYTLAQPPGSTMPGVGGTGDLAELRFRALAPGLADITLRQLLVTNTANEPIEVDLEGAVVTIGEPTPEPQPHIYLPYANRQH